jgi:hypothetical protein
MARPAEEAGLAPQGDGPRIVPAERFIFSLAFLLLATSGAVANGPMCTPPRIDPASSLLVLDSAVDKSTFALRKTIDAILGSMKSPVPPTQSNRESFLRTLFDSFNDPVRTNHVSKLPMPVDLRPFEAALDPKKLLDPGDPMGLVPVALVNRLDLAPKDWSNCGEHRIIYSFSRPFPAQPTESMPSGRMYLIFEARTENPRGQGFEGCRATADFWRSLTDERDAEGRARRLEQFYYQGIPGTAGPVVQAKHYGAPLGQVRGSFLSTYPVETSTRRPIQSAIWQLREWLVVNSGHPTPASFVSVPVNDTPLTQFYLDANGTGLDQPLNPALEASERAAFQAEFVSTSLQRLFAPDVDRNQLTSGHPDYKPELDPKSGSFDKDKYKIDILGRSSVLTSSRFNEFQSVAEGTEDEPRSQVGEGLKAKIDAQLGYLDIGPMQKPDLRDALNRAGAVTCGGCHHFSRGLSVGKVGGKTISWPDSIGFVHVSEEGAPSPALTDVFLPFRSDSLGKAVCIPTAGGEAFRPAAGTASDAARRGRWESLLAAARAENDPAAQRATLEQAVQLIMVLREEERLKPGFFVTHRRAH